MNIIEKEDRGPYIRTFTGRKFHPLTPRPEDFCLTDVVHQLSRVVRWGGCSRTPFSVLHHSLWCQEIARGREDRAFPAGELIDAPEGYRLINSVSKDLLFHDLSEAYICDVPKPIKCALGNYKSIEDGIMLAAAQRYHFRYPLTDHGKEIDELALVAERIALFDPNVRCLSEDYFNLSHLFVDAINTAHIVTRVSEYDSEESISRFMRLAEQYRIDTEIE